MNLLPTVALYVVVGFIEWYLALRRTLAVTRNEKVLLITIVFIENLLGLWVLQNFIRSNDWWIAISYSIGGAVGALMVCNKSKDKIIHE